MCLVVLSAVVISKIFNKGGGGALSTTLQIWFCLASEFLILIICNYCSFIDL